MLIYRYSFKSRTWEDGFLKHMGWSCIKYGDDGHPQALSVESVLVIQIFQY